uniref:OrfA n=1 Tax=Steinernema glaseri TaxID=37863 RepID=A0A1I8ANM5_9BILA
MSWLKKPTSRAFKEEGTSTGL